MIGLSYRRSPGKGWVAPEPLIVPQPLFHDRETLLSAYLQMPLTDQSYQRAHDWPQNRRQHGNEFSTAKNGHGILP